MRLLAELQQHVRSYVDAQSELKELHYWLASHAQQLSEDLDASTYSERVWILLSEFGDGCFPEEELRNRMRAALSPIASAR
jgi:hypothetical protein